MTPAKFEQKFSGQSTIAKKVFQFIPLTEHWTATEIASEMRRATRSSPDFHILQGCINSLKDSGLVVETGHGKFRKIEIKEVKEKEMKAPTQVVSIVKAEEKQERKPLEMLGDIAKKVRETAKAMNTMANEIEEAALKYGEEVEKQAASLGKLQQLQQLLKSL